MLEFLLLFMSGMLHFFGGALARSVAWLLNTDAPGDSKNDPSPHDSPDDKMAADVSKEPYEPSVIDVLVTRAMLSKGLRLPPEIVDSIVDQAEYWPHTTSSAVDGGQDIHSIPAVVGRDDSRANAFLVGRFLPHSPPTHPFATFPRLQWCAARSCVPSRSASQSGLSRVPRLPSIQTSTAPLCPRGPPAGHSRPTPLIV